MKSLTIIVLGYVVRGPLGGLAWHHIQYVLGLQQLGHDVCFLEDSGDYPSCYDPSRHMTDTDPGYGIRFASYAFKRLGLQDRWAYYDAHSKHWLGPRSENALELCSTADLLINVSGINQIRPWMSEIPARVFIETDPAFTQIRHLTEEGARKLADQHTHFFTFGENFGHPECRIPNDGYPWKSTRQPIVLDAWNVAPGNVDAGFTTVMQWDSYAGREYQNVRFGMKAESFDPYMALPKQTDAKLELAIGSAKAPRQELEKHGWIVRDPLEISRNPWTYQNYIQSSKAEFSVAKHGYVISNSGWFSERSACYLASGRPVIVQETGCSEWLKARGGVITYSTNQEALAGIEEVNENYTIHCDAARSLAEEYFDSDKVLSNLIDEVFNTEPQAACDNY